jgi:hypothetical protein
MIDRTTLAQRVAPPLFRFNWWLIAVWLALGTLGRTPADGLFFAALGLHFLVALLEPLLDLAPGPIVRGAALGLVALVLGTSVAVSGNAMREAALEDKRSSYYDEGGTTPGLDGEYCEPEVPEV